MGRHVDPWSGALDSWSTQAQRDALKHAEFGAMLLDWGSVLLLSCLNTHDRYLVRKQFTEMGMSQCTPSGVKIEWAPIWDQNMCAHSPCVASLWTTRQRFSWDTWDFSW